MTVLPPPPRPSVYGAARYEEAKSSVEKDPRVLFCDDLQNISSSCCSSSNSSNSSSSSSTSSSSSSSSSNSILDLMASTVSSVTVQTCEE